jgi:hypothetical protein
VYSIDNNTILAIKELIKMFSIKILISTIRKNTDQKKDMLLKSLEDE